MSFSRTSRASIVLALSAMGFYSLNTATATPLPDPPYETSTTSSSWGGTWNSNISCTGASGGSIIEEGAVTLDQAVDCTITNRKDSNGNSLPDLSGTCALYVEYVDVPSTCDGTTLTNNLLCSSLSAGNITTSSTLNCNPDASDPPPAICEGNVTCTAKVGVPAPTGNKWSKNDCTNVFGSADAVILNSVIETVGANCQGGIKRLDQIAAEFCTSGTFTDASADPSCASSGNSGKNASKVAGTVDQTLPVIIALSPNTVNVSCSPNKDNGDVRFTIFGEEAVDVSQINTSTLTLEGVEAHNCATGFVNEDNYVDLTCDVASCPDLGPKLETKRGTSSTVTVVVNGELTSGTPIQGSTVTNTSPPPK